MANGPSLPARSATISGRSGSAVARTRSISRDSMGPGQTITSPSMLDGHTCTTAPHKHFGCEANDVIKQLHMRRVEKVIMAGARANNLLQSHISGHIQVGHG